jgi:ADP-ribose pyrophosphatase
MNSPQKNLTILSEEVIYTPSNRWDVRKLKVRLLSGTEREYFIKVKKPFVIVVAEKNGAFLCVEQYRVTMKQRSLEFMAGGIDDEEEPIEAARRELKEETGYVAEHLKQIGSFFEANGSCRLHGHIFLAEGLTFTGEEREEYEADMETRWVPIKEFETMIREGKLLDGKTITAYTHWKLRTQPSS